MASTATDRTINKVALCSAIFAGAAYVGYSVVRQAFGRSLVPGNNTDAATQRALSRLGGSRRDASTSTEALLGTLEQDGTAARLILRPLSVQERIRELNLRARHFAETILAIHMQDDSRRAIAHTRSLTSSPTRCSARMILSPIDITHLGSSRCSSIENLSKDSPSNSKVGATPSPLRASFSSLPPSLRKRWSRRSLRLRSPDSGTFSTKEEQEEVEAEGERLLDEREAELRRRLQGFEDGTTKILTPYEARSLVALLHSKDPEMVEKALVTISNSAAFTTNQDHLRDAGCIIRLQHLVIHSDPRVRMAAITAVGNLALNTSNQKEMGQMVPLLLPIVMDSNASYYSLQADDDHLLLQTLLTLTNIAALTNWHKQLTTTLTKLFDLTQSTNTKIRMQSLRLLVNLSTNEEMVPHLLAAKAPEYVWNMLDDSQAEDQLLRVVTLLSNLVCTQHKHTLDPTLDLPLDDKTAEPDSLYSLVYSEENRPDVLEHLEYLMKSHPHEDIRVKARLIYNVVSSKKNEHEEEDEEIDLR